MCTTTALLPRRFETSAGELAGFPRPSLSMDQPRCTPSRPRVTPRIVRTKRRRFKREVRIAGIALMAGCPFVLGAIYGLGRGSELSSRVPQPQPRAALAVAQPDAATGPGRLISLSIEPALDPPAGRRVFPMIVRPAGYLLPDDGSGESAHVAAGD